MPRRPSRRSLLIVLALAGIFAVVLLVRYSAWPGENALVGQTESQVCARYGKARVEFAGHYGRPSLDWTQQFKGEVKSAKFGRLGGQIYVTFEKRNGQWVVISNSYLPRGGAF